MNQATEQRGGKVIYADVSLKGLTLDIATRRKQDALPTIRKMLDALVLHLPCGQKVDVTVALDDFAFGTPVFTQATAAPTGFGTYKISLGVGLIVQLWVISRGIAADKNALRGRTKTQLLRPDVRSAGRESALGDFVFHFMLSFILWHEVAHIALGHLDWLNQKTGLSMINEFGYEPMPDNIFTRLQTLEADADRQAALWCAATIEYAAEKNPFLRYTSTADLFYDIGYIYGAMFGFLDAIDGRPDAGKRKHPKADIRLGVALAFVENYLKCRHGDAATTLQSKVVAGGIDAVSRSLHLEKEPFDPLAVYWFMSENGARLDQMGVRAFQHAVSTGADGSFHILD